MAKKLPFKALTATAVAAAMGAAAFTPAAVASADSTAFVISEVVVEKDGQLYSIELNTYIQMKGADVEWLLEDGKAITPSFVKSSSDKVFTLNEYVMARGAVEGGDIAKTLELLDASGEAQEVTYGSVTVGDEGLVVTEPTEDEEPGEEPTAAEELVVAYEEVVYETYADWTANAELRAAAHEAVEELEAGEEKTELEERIAAVEKVVTDAVEAVNDATTQPNLLTALDAFFLDVDSNFIVKYFATLGSGKTNLSVDSVQEFVYSVAFLDAFASAIDLTNGTVNQLKLSAALTYGAETGLLENVDQTEYFAAYVQVAEGYTVATDFDTVAKIQTSMIDEATVTVVNAADGAVKAAMDAPAGSDTIKNAQELVDAIPVDVVVTSEMTINTGLQEDDYAKAGYNAILDDLRAVKPVIEALDVATINQARLLTALNNEKFERVYEDYIVEYAVAFAAVYNNDPSDVISVAQVQAIIDGENDAVAETKVAAAEALPSNNTVKAAQEAIDRLAPDYEATETTPARTVVEDFQDRLDAAEAMIAEIAALADINDLDENSSNADIKAALKAVHDVEKVKENPAFDYATVDENFLTEIATELALATQTNAGEVQTAVFDAILAEVNALDGTSEEADIKAALKALDTVVSTQDPVPFNYATVDENFLTEIATKIDTDSPADAEAVQASVIAAILAEVNKLDGTSEDAAIKAALKALDTAVSTHDSVPFNYTTVDENFLTEIATKIDTDSPADAEAVQASVIAAILAEVNKLDGTSEDADIKAALKALDTAVSTQDQVPFKYSTVDENVLNAIAVQIDADSPADAAAVQASVIAAYLSAVNALDGDDADEDISAALKALANASNDLNVDTIRTSLLNDYAVAIDDAGTLSAAEIQDIVVDLNNLSDVNAAETATAMRTALNAVAVAESDFAGDSYEDYLNLSSQARLEIAEIILANRAEKTNGKYADTSAINLPSVTDAYKAILTGAAGTGVNLGTATQVRTALNTYGLESFTSLSAGLQVDVAGYLVANRPEVKLTDGGAYVSGGYTSIAAIEAAIEAALAE